MNNFDVDSNKIRKYGISHMNKVALSPIIREDFSQILLLKKQFEVLERLFNFQLFTDYYRYVKYQDIIYDKDDIKNLEVINEYSEYEKLFQNRNLYLEMFDSLLEYYNASAYDKILLSKCLSDFDINKLTKINPFFYNENKKYDVDISLDLINRQIQKWQKSFPKDIQKSYYETSDFLINLYKINSNISKKIIQEIIENLNKNIFIQNTYTDNESINVNGMIIDEMLLSKIIKDYYENTKDKKLIYERDK